VKTSSVLAATSLVVALLGSILPDVALAEAGAKDPQQVADEALLKRVEQSGALDHAVERTLQRLMRRQMEAKQTAQADAVAKRIEMARNARPVNAARDHLLGDPQAPVSIIEYSDFECPFCKRFHGVPEEVVKRLAGKVNFVWRQFPLEMHGPAAAREAEASECAARIGGNDAFWSYANEVMRRTRSNGQGLPAGDGDPLVALAAELKIDSVAFGKCLESGESQKAVGEDLKDGEGSGVTGTPGIVLRNAATGKALLAEGAISADTLEQGIRELLPAD
jgi:protein-disulfide isomerase